MIYHVRDLLFWTKEQIAELPLKHSIEFEDGSVVETYRNETRYSHVFWEVFRQYSKVVILPKHHVTTVIGNGDLDSGTHFKLCSAMYRSIVEDMGILNPVDREPLLALFYRTISDAMSLMSLWSEEDVISIDILDFIQIALHPEVQKLNAEARLDTEKIKYAYENTIKLVKQDLIFEHNGLAKAIRSGMVKDNQVNQCVNFRGFVTEVDGAIFQTPVWGNYTTGMRRFYDFVADSRTAAKSHFYADTALKDSEYMGRKFQLFSTMIERMHYVDCGTSETISWFVKGPEYDEAGVEIYPGDLTYLAGKNYIDEATHGLKWIEGKEKHLIGKTIQLRSLLKCRTREHDQHGVCHVCAGKLSENISAYANLGHLGSIATTQQTTQNILSIKHVNTSSTALKILLGDHERRYFNIGPHGTAFYLHEHLKPLGIKLVVGRDDAPGLINLPEPKVIEQLSLQNVSQLKTIDVVTKEGTVQFTTPVDVSQKNKPAMMSIELLQYIKTRGWTTDENNNFVIDMTRWNFKNPVFVMQNKEISFVDLAKQIGSMVESSQKTIKTRLVEEAPAVLLRDLFDLVNSKLRVNILSFEILICGLMVESKTSYAMPRGEGSPMLGVSELLTKYRSMGPALAYQDQNLTLMEPINFFKGRRPDSPMDVFMRPREVVDAYTKR